MAKGYWIAHVTVTDPDPYKKYVEAGAEAFQKYNARVLARGGRHEVLEGAGKARNVVIEFGSFEDAHACFNSPEYQAARKHRENAGDADIVIVEGT